MPMNGAMPVQSRCRIDPCGTEASCSHVRIVSSNVCFRSGSRIARRTVAVGSESPRTAGAGGGFGTGSAGQREPAKAGLTKDQVLKVPASVNMTPDLYSYILAHTREPQILSELRSETAFLSGSHMQITPDQGQFLGLMVQATGAKRVIEVGVYTGYSSLAMAMALPEDGKLFALDKDALAMSVAQKYWEKAGVRHKVEERVGNAAESLRLLLQQLGPGSIDIGFIDADKRAYWEYHNLLMELVRPGGLIIADNVLFYGKVIRPEDSDKAAKALADYNDRLLGDNRIDLSIIPVGDGMALCRKRG